MRVALLLFSGLVFATGAAPRRPGWDRSIWLLGEVHDHPEGHRKRYEMLKARVESGWRPAIAMEQFDREFQPDLERAMAHCKEADCVIAAASGGRRWDWPLYKPVIDLALRWKLPLLAANVSRADAGMVMKEGLGAVLDSKTVKGLRLNRPAARRLLKAQKKVIIRSHCGLLPVDMAGGMVNAQLARDVWMAGVLQGEAGRGVVLLAGNGHVRKDLGVPNWLKLPRNQMWSVGFVEGAEEGRYDRVVRVKPVARPDPCEQLRLKHGAAE